jgi:hypothetical protein
VDNRYIWNELKTDVTETENKNRFATRESMATASKWNTARFSDTYGTYKEVVNPEEDAYERLHNAMLDGYYGTKERMRTLVDSGQDPYTTSTADTLSCTTSTTYAKQVESRKPATPSDEETPASGYYN